MKRLSHYLAIFGFLLLVATGCTEKSAVIPQTSHPELVDFDVATASAKSFNPGIYLGTADKATVLFEGNSIKSSFTLNDSKGNPSLYVFNFSGGKGCLILSADYRVDPVMAYMPDSELPEQFLETTGIVPATFAKWTTAKLEEVGNLHMINPPVNKESRSEWENFFAQHQVSNNISAARLLPPDPGGNNPPGTPTSPDCGNYSYTRGPTVPYQWGQTTSYMEGIPAISCGHPVTGCVPTAMAQVIAKWKPVNSMNYNYALMPLTSGNSEVQRLMHDAGIAVNVSYGCAGTSIDISQNGIIATALKSTFGIYSATAATFDQGQLVTNLESGWPVILIGSTGQSTSVSTEAPPGGDVAPPTTGTGDFSHAWICDGYRFAINGCANQYMPIAPGTPSAPTYHMNWGWYEVGNTYSCNGWFADYAAVKPSSNSAGVTFHMKYMIHEIHALGAN